VSTRDVFSDAELGRLRGFPEISREELVRYFTLSGADEAFVRAKRRPGTVLGVAVQLCTLPWLGFVPDELSAAPTIAVARVATQLGVDAGEMTGYGEREQTRTDHLREVVAYLGWCSADPRTLTEVDEFLLVRAMEHDAPSLLFRLACEQLITARVVRPGPVKLLERVATARGRRTGNLRPDRAPAHRDTTGGAGRAAGGRSGDRHEQAAVAGRRPHRGLGDGGEDRGQEAEVPARPGRPPVGSVRPTGRTLPVPGRGRAAQLGGEVDSP